MIGQFEGRFGGPGKITTPDGRVFRTNDSMNWWLEGTDPGLQPPAFDERARDVEELAHWFDLLAAHDAHPIECLPSQWAQYAEMLRELNTSLGLYKMGNKELYDRLEARDKALDLCHKKNADLVARINELERALAPAIQAAKGVDVGKTVADVRAYIKDLPFTTDAMVSHALQKD